MNGTIGFHNLKVNCLIGTLESEKNHPQNLFLDVAIKMELANSDHIESTVDYTWLAGECIRIAKSRHFSLIETLGKEILNAILQDKKISFIHIRIKKPEAIPDADWAFFELEHERILSQ